MIFDFAYLTLVLALILCAFGMAAGFWGGRLGTIEADPSAQPSGKGAIPGVPYGGSWGARLTRSSFHSIYAVCGLVGIAAVVLWYGLLSDQFQISYIWNSSERSLPTFYKFAAIWGGQAGSLLFWTLLLSLFSTATALTFRTSQRALMPYVNGTLLATLLFFLVLLVFSANPFEQIGVVPSDGRGLNPLLQNYWMVIHPVMLYLGWVGLTVPFAFAVAALLSKRLDRRWVRTVRRWTLIPWMFLSAGIIMGSQWAYMELGWGGYWAWDPVENASFLPWLTATAFLHSVIIQEQRGILKVWNVTLIWLTFTLVILGTFTTRSGILSSVHSFAQSPVGPYFLVFLAVTTVGFLLLLFQRLPYLQGENEIDSISSREGAFLANNWLFAGIAFVVLWGTFYPMFSEILTGRAHFGSGALVQPSGGTFVPATVYSDGGRSSVGLAADRRDGSTPSVQLAGRGGVDLYSISASHQPKCLSGGRLQCLYICCGDDWAGVCSGRDGASAVKRRAGCRRAMGIDSTQRSPLWGLRSSLWYRADWGRDYW